MTLETPAYETETCSRCHGSGNYSWNQINGSTCFKCRGQKRTYTKRGYSALLYAKQLRAVPIADVKIGDRIYWGKGGRCTVTAIDDPAPSGVRYLRDGEMIDALSITVHGRDGFKSSFGVNEEVRAGWTDEMVANVNAYQAALTKAGKLSAKAKKSGEFE